MGVSIKFRAQPDRTESLFDDIVDAVYHAAALSQEDDGSEVKVQRGVKYSTSDEFKWYTMQTVKVPKPLTASGMQATVLGPETARTEINFSRR
jgi:hypothetical protein